MRERRRVVVTGVGLVSPLGVGSDSGWDSTKKFVAGAVGIVVMGVCYGLLQLAGKVAARNREREGAMY